MILGPSADGRRISALRPDLYSVSGMAEDPRVTGTRAVSRACVPRSPEERAILHGVVLTVSSPQGESMSGGGRRNESIAQLDAMTS
jgi:hypothetical protein